MTKLDKLAGRFKAYPKDFTWDELVTMLSRLGFKELQGRGSSVKFFNEEINCIIQLHKPHPAKVLKRYIVKEVLAVLIGEKLI